MSPDDYLMALKLFHVNPPNDNVKRLAQRLNLLTTSGTGANFDTKSEIFELAQKRHECAHESAATITNIWLRVVPGRILRLAVVFDILASAGSYQLHVGDNHFLRDEKWLTDSRISLRFIRQRTSDVAEYHEGRPKAAKVQKDNDALALFGSAYSQKIPLEAIISQDITLNLLNWSIPTVL